MEDEYDEVERVYWTNGLWNGFVSGMLVGALLVGFVAIFECRK
jgi:hypothetical protein